MISPLDRLCRPSVLLLLLSGLGLGASSLSGEQGAAESLEELTANKTFWGEPYELAGNRIFFTDYFHIRPGVLDWINADGESVYTAEERVENPTYGPRDAQINRPSSPYGIRIVAQPANRMGPIIQREKPWEEHYVIFKTVIKDGDLYRAWGKSVPGGDCYFESADGINWERPILRQREFDGSLENNLLAGGPNGTVFIDPHGPPEERYKAVGGTRKPFDEFKAFAKKHPDRWETRILRGDWDKTEAYYCIRGSVSPDGLHWKTLPEPFTFEHSDGMETGYYDTDLEKYVIYTRTWMVGARSQNWTGDHREMTWVGEFHGSGRRAIGRMESDTFGEFEVSQPVIVPVPGETSPSESFYTSIHTTMPGAPDFHLMFPTVWDTRDDSSSIGLWSSHDGRIWNRLPGGAVLETAPFGEWDGGCIFSFPSLIELPNGDFALPYKGYNLPHKYPRGTMELYAGYAIWPKGRIVAVEADEIGEFATVGILPPGRTIQINALTKRAGGVWVELGHADDRPVAGRTFAESDPIQGDAFWQTVSWNGETDIKVAPGETLVIKFRIDRGKIFGLQFQ